MVLKEMLFVADYRMEDWEDEASAAELFEAVKDDLINEIQGSPWDVWAASGCLFAKLWEHFVRLNPKAESWPESTQAEMWRSLEG
jgi:hypothetical protein